MKESVALVDEHDQMYGTMDKLAAHRAGKLHRAISVFIFNSNGYLLLQRRALDKYHSGGLWSNTCCSHPRLGEKNVVAARRRLNEEMGLETDLSYAFHFCYYAELGNGIIEYELDHVFLGRSDAAPQLNLSEAADFKYMSLSQLGEELTEYPERYSSWLNICYEQLLAAYVKWEKHGEMVD